MTSPILRRTSSLWRSTTSRSGARCCWRSSGSERMNLLSATFRRPFWALGKSEDCGHTAFTRLLGHLRLENEGLRRNERVAVVLSWVGSGREGLNRRRGPLLRRRAAHTSVYVG